MSVDDFDVAIDNDREFDLVGSLDTVNCIETENEALGVGDGVADFDAVALDDTDFDREAEDSNEFDEVRDFESEDSLVIESDIRIVREAVG